MTQALPSFDAPWDSVPNVSPGSLEDFLPNVAPAQEQLSLLATPPQYDHRYISQSISQDARTVPAANNEISVTIGSMHTTTDLASVFFKCSMPGCEDKTFGRWYDLRRHYRSVHETREEVFWCKTPGCERSETVGDRPFPRKDKLANHVQKMHGGSSPTC